RIAITVVPFAPALRERAETISAGTDIPGFGDELQLAQQRILADRPEQRRGGIESCRTSTECGREIEAVAVDPRDCRVVAKHVEREACDLGPIERQHVDRKR